MLASKTIPKLIQICLTPKDMESDRSSCSEYCDISSRNTYCRFINNRLPSSSCGRVLSNEVNSTAISEILDHHKKMWVKHAINDVGTRFTVYYLSRMQHVWPFFDGPCLWCTCWYFKLRELRQPSLWRETVVCLMQNDSPWIVLILLVLIPKNDENFCAKK